MLWTQLADELDRNAVQLLWDAWRGQHVDRDAAALAAFNTLSFAYTQTLGQPPMVGAAAADTSDQAAVDAAFQSALDAADPKATKAMKAIPIPWTLIISVILKLIERRFS